jgi:hypothetical protein
MVAEENLHLEISNSKHQFYNTRKGNNISVS